MRSADDRGGAVLAELDGATGRPIGAAVEERFELGGLLGRGGQATVYRARDRLLGRDVALKVFDPDSDLASADRVQREMRTLAALEHPGIVSVYDVGVVDGRPYLVMRLVDRGSLADLLADGPLSPSQAAVLAAAMCDALGYVHTRGLVHRDLKPANILLATDPAGGGLVPLIADFGTASPSPGPAGADAVTGTPAYLAPEQVAGLDASPAADVYALGLVVLEAVTGRREFSGPAEEAVPARLDRDPVVPPGLPDALAMLLTAMTTRDPQHRPTAVRAGEMARQVAVRDDDAPTRRHRPFDHALVLPEAPDPGPGPRWSGPRRALLAGALAVGVAAAVVAVRGDPPLPAPVTPITPAPAVPVAGTPIVPPTTPPEVASTVPPAAAVAPVAGVPAPSVPPRPQTSTPTDDGPDDGTGASVDTGWNGGQSNRPRPHHHGGRHRR